jgi:4-amino-4-deoxy-L-arabinose transferase-like glycosyltransferase
LITGLLLVLGGIFLYCSTWEYETLKTLINGSAADGDVETYTKDFHQNLTARALFFGIALVAIAGLAFVFFKRLTQITFSILEDGKSFFKGWKRFHRQTYSDATLFQNVLFVLILLLGFIFRAALLNEPVIYDEAFTYNYYAAKPVYVILSDYSYPNNQIFHTLLVKLSTVIFGVGHFALRIPVFLAGIATLYFSYFIALRFLKNRNTALVVLSVLAFSGVLIEYPAIARGYSLVVLFTLLAIGAADHYLASGNRFSLTFVAIILALAFFTIPVVIYPALMIFGWMLFEKWKTDKKTPWGVIAAGAGSAFLAMLLYVPVIITYGFSQLMHHPTMGDNHWSTFSETLGSKLVKMFQYFTPALGAWLMIVVLFIAVMGVIANKKIRSLVLTFLLLIPLVLLQSNLAPPRVWTFFLPFIALAVGAGFLALIPNFQKGKNMLAPFVLIALLIPSFGNAVKIIAEETEYKRHNRYHDAIEIVDYIKGDLNKNTRVVVAFPLEAPLEFYFRVQNVPVEAIFRKPEQVNRYIIVYDKFNQSLEAAWNDRKLPIELLDNAEDMEFYEDPYGRISTCTFSIK